MSVPWRPAAVVILITAIILSFLVISFPKRIYTEKEGDAVTCSCFGGSFWYGTRCVGFRTNCTAVELPDQEMTCVESTCKEIVAMLAQGQSVAASMLASESMDVVLVIDASNSMEGDRLLAAKGAAIRLVNGITEKERLGVVALSDGSVVVQNFTGDKEAIATSIMGIQVMGGTNYLPSLQEAERMLSETESGTRKGIIFLSDGIPDDDPDAIVAKSEELREEGVALFTISFGIDTGNATNILRLMVKGDAAAESDDWYREYTDPESVADAFVNAWDKISTVDVIRVTPTFVSGTAIASAETESVGARLELDGHVLAGETAEKTVCAPALEAKVVAVDGDRIINITPVYRSQAYWLPADSLPPGNYALSFSASFKSDQDGSCVFSGRGSLGTVKVVPADRPCGDPSCERVRERLEDFDLAASEEVFLPRAQGPGRVAVLLDTSESMQLQLEEVTGAVDRLNRLLSSDDERSLIIFSSAASLALPLTRDENAFTAALQDITPMGTTRFIPALEKAGFLFADQTGKDVVVIVTDGRGHDEEGSQGVFAEGSSLISKGVCVIVLGYGTQLLREKETSALLQEVADRSKATTGCGGFVYAPTSEELTGVVTAMFGGERTEDGPLRLVTEFDRPPVFSANRNKVVIRVTAAKTGLVLPASDLLCIPDPVVLASVENHKGKKIADLTPTLQAGGMYEAYLPHLIPGRYRLVTSASLPIDGCELSARIEKEFVALGSLEGRGEVAVLSGLLALAFILVMALRLMKKLA